MAQYINISERVRTASNEDLIKAARFCCSAPTSDDDFMCEGCPFNSKDIHNCDGHLLELANRLETSLKMNDAEA